MSPSAPSMTIAKSGLIGASSTTQRDPRNESVSSSAVKETSTFMSGFEPVFTRASRAVMRLAIEPFMSAVPRP